jgi:uncharacterized protein
MHRRVAQPALLFCTLFFFFLATGNSQIPKASEEKSIEWTGLPQRTGGWHTLHADKGQVSIGFGALRIAPSSGTNLFRAPGGGFNMVNAPMVLASADKDFTLVARVSAQLVERYDVGALVLYQDETHWAKLCFENSAHKEATVVTVVTRDRSDDANSETIASPFVYLALARHGDEFSLHFSRDGREWRLARHFEQAFADTLKVGFAAHSDANPHFVVSFSEIAYRPAAPHNLRQLEADDLPTREPQRAR